MSAPRQTQAILEARAKRAEWRTTARVEERQLAALELIADALDTIKDDLVDIRIRLTSRTR